MRGGVVVVETYGELVQDALARRRPDKECSRRIVGQRHNAEQLQDHRIGHGRPLGRCWHLRLERGHLTPLSSFIAGEEERAVSADRPSYAIAKNISFKRNDGSWGIEEVLGVELFIAHELDGAAVETVRAGLVNARDDDPGVEPLLGGKRGDE